MSLNSTKSGGKRPAGKSKSKGKNKITIANPKRKAMNSFLCFSSKIQADEPHLVQGDADKSTTERISDLWNGMNFREQLPYLLQAHYLDLRRKQGGAVDTGAWHLGKARQEKGVVSEARVKVESGQPRKEASPVFGRVPGSAIDSNDVCGDSEVLLPPPTTFAHPNTAAGSTAPLQSTPRKKKRPPPISFSPPSKLASSSIFARHAGASMTGAAVHQTTANNLFDSPTSLSRTPVSLPAISFTPIEQETSFFHGVTNQPEIAHVPHGGVGPENTENYNPKTTPTPHYRSNFVPDYDPSLPEICSGPRPLKEADPSACTLAVGARYYTPGFNTGAYVDGDGRGSGDANRQLRLRTAGNQPQRGNGGRVGAATPKPWSFGLPSPCPKIFGRNKQTRSFGFPSLHIAPELLDLASRKPSRISSTLLDKFGDPNDSGFGGSSEIINDPYPYMEEELCLEEELYSTLLQQMV